MVQLNQLSSLRETLVRYNLILSLISLAWGQESNADSLTCSTSALSNWVSDRKRTLKSETYGFFNLRAISPHVCNEQSVAVATNRILEVVGQLRLSERYMVSRARSQCNDHLLQEWERFVDVHCLLLGLAFRLRKWEKNKSKLNAMLDSWRSNGATYGLRIIIASLQKSSEIWIILNFNSSKCIKWIIHHMDLVGQHG